MIDSGVLAFLANLVIVRNHILIVINDRSASNRDQFSALNKMRLDLDKKFVQCLVEKNEIQDFIAQPSPKATSVELPDIVKKMVGPENWDKLTYTFTQGKISEGHEKVEQPTEKQLSLFDSETVNAPVDAKPVDAEPVNIKASTDSEASEIAAAIARQKLELRKQGRSNKRLKNDAG